MCFFRGLLKSLISPLPLFWIFLIAGFVFYLLRKKRLVRWWIGCSIIWLFIISTPFLPKYLIASLENQHIQIQPSDINADSTLAKGSNVHILVLGSGYTIGNRLSFSSQLSFSGLARLVESIRLYQLMPKSRLVFSGYEGRQLLPQAEVSALAARELGIDSTVISTICKPWNTKSEAEEYVKRFGTDYKLYLITDAAHMSRAIWHFRNAGLDPIPAPTNFLTRKNYISRSYFDYLPGHQYIRFMEIVFRENLGLLWAKMDRD
jgi:uncharacterized SAM-binding protein YcdF (DUF218 family)